MEAWELVNCRCRVVLVQFSEIYNPCHLEANKGATLFIYVYTMIYYRPVTLIKYIVM